jgi:hypothetical protein
MEALKLALGAIVVGRKISEQEEERRITIVQVDKKDPMAQLDVEGKV